MLFINMELKNMKNMTKIKVEMLLTNEKTEWLLDMAALLSMRKQVGVKLPKDDLDLHNSICNELILRGA